MSIRAFSWAIDTYVGSPTLKLILMTVANYADEYGHAWPSQVRIANEAELSERAVRDGLKRLEEMGFITRKERPRKENKARQSDLITLTWKVAKRPAPETELNLPAGDAGMGGNLPADDAEPTGSSFQNLPAAHSKTTRNDVPVNRNIEPSVEQLEETRVREAHAASSPRKVSDAFEEFWKAYPHKVGKGAAQAAFVKVAKSKQVSFEDLMAGLERYANKTDDRPWANPSTWLNQKRWLDEPAAGQDLKKPQAPARRMAI